jgi:release factor glutamine methyltransferase
LSTGVPTPDTATCAALTVAQALAAAGIERREAGYLLQAVTGASAARLAAHPEWPLPPSQARRFAELAARRRHGEPIAYLVGHREFYGSEFEVNPAVLIPRPETERLVELALERLAPPTPARVLDLGTGSGAIALTIAALRPRAQVVAVDVSDEALAVAGRNRARLVPERSRVQLEQSDWFGALGGKRFDLIVANPPYVAADDPHLHQGDLRFEPKQALVGGEDGLEAIRRIVAEAPGHLVAGGWLLFEHGYDQAQACRELLRIAGFRELVAEKDLAGQPRIAGGRLTG